MQAAAFLSLSSHAAISGASGSALVLLLQLTLASAAGWFPPSCAGLLPLKNTAEQQAAS